VEGGVSATTGNLVGLAAALLAAVVSFCIYVMGVFSRDRAISRVAALVFCICAAVAVWTFARVLL
jgi:preprotein translocase subunit SecF